MRRQDETDEVTNVRTLGVRVLGLLPRADVSLAASQDYIYYHAPFFDPIITSCFLIYYS